MISNPITDHPLKDWVPYKLTNDNGQLLCHWLNTFALPFIDPFFDDTILKVRGLENGSRLKPVSDIRMINTWAADFKPVEPAAIIFHISRCGSTLLSQLLATQPQHIVLSEVPVFDDVLRLPFYNPDIDDDAANSLFSAALTFYGQPKTEHNPGGGKQQVFIKTDCWHLFFYEQLRRLYPKTPFIIVYRSPDAVFRSHTKMAGGHTVRGILEPQLFGFEPESPVYQTSETFLAAVLEAYLKKGLEIAESDSNLLLLNYNEGPRQMINKLVAFVGLSLNPTDLQNMYDRSQYHSKKPGERFSEEPVQQIPDVLTGAMDTYYSLDKKRLALMAV